MESVGYEEFILSEYEHENRQLRSRVARLEEALHSISLGSQNSMTMKEDLGREARRALEEK